MQQKFGFRAALKLNIQGLNVLKNGRIHRADVFEVESPFHRWESMVRNRDTPEHQPGFSVGVSQYIFGPLPVELPGATFQRPCREEFHGRPAVVPKGERYFGRGEHSSGGRVGFWTVI